MKGTRLLPSKFFGIGNPDNSQSVGKRSTNSVGELTFTVLLPSGT